MKEVEIIEVHAMPDHIHMLVRIPLKLSVSVFMGFLICEHCRIEPKSI